MSSDLTSLLSHPRTWVRVRVSVRVSVRVRFRVRVRVRVWVRVRVRVRVRVELLFILHTFMEVPLESILDTNRLSTSLFVLLLLYDFVSAVSFYCLFRFYCLFPFDVGP